MKVLSMANGHRLCGMIALMDFFHRDLLYPKEQKEKQTINITSLEDALNYAEQDIKDRWEFYKERYLKKLKK